MAQRAAPPVLMLSWEATDGIELYRLTAIESDGQHRFIGSFEQGPFDTALEVAQWAWRTMAKELPPSSC
jgi:hypothetical protein